MSNSPDAPPVASSTEFSTAAAEPSAQFRLPPTSDILTERLIEAARDCGAGPGGNRVTRADGWTRERIELFLHTLAGCGVVARAVRAVGMTTASAYRLRNSAAGRPFHHAWISAQQLARRRLSDELMARSIEGNVELIVRDGRICGENHRHDNRLAMYTLTRLDKQTASLADEESRVARIVTQEFDEYVGLVADGGGGAMEFVAARLKNDGGPSGVREPRLLERLAEYQASGRGLSEQKVADLLADGIDPPDVDANGEFRPHPIIAEVVFMGLNDGSVTPGDDRSATC